MLPLVTNSLRATIKKLHAQQVCYEVYNGLHTAELVFTVKVEAVIIEVPTLQTLRLRAKPRQLHCMSLCSCRGLALSLSVCNVGTSMITASTFTVKLE